MPIDAQSAAARPPAVTLRQFVPPRGRGDAFNAWLHRDPEVGQAIVLALRKPCLERPPLALARLTSSNLAKSAGGPGSREPAGRLE